jgi:hypothetical protein
VSSLRDQAAADLRSIVEDPAGFGWSITITNPAGTSAQVYGLSQDIALAIDPLTGVAVAGRTATVALTRASLAAAALGDPVAVVSEAGKPWLVSFEDTDGTIHLFKIAEQLPDRTIGLNVYRLEVYRQ